VKRPVGLVQQNTLLLATAFVGIELLVVLAFAWLVMLPMARRSADDLAGLMVLSAQTWAELPPATRPAFEAELRQRQSLQIRPEVSGVSRDEWHPAFFYLLEDALAGRVGPDRHLIRTRADGQDWYWARLPAGGGTLAVGLSGERINSRPLAALLIGLVAGLALAVGLALLLARRVVAPLARLEAASAQLGQGETPDLLPETGPREIVALSRRFNTMAVQVQELMTARTTLLAGVSHDLRTPLARMRLALEMLREAPSAALLNRLDRDVEQMNQLIGNVLELARGLANEPAVPVDVALMLHELAAEHASPDGPLVRVRCERCQARLPELSVRRALGNLLQNALRYAAPNPVELVCEPDGGHWRLGVLDRGPGIPAEQVEAMFQPFHRLEPSRSPVTGGSGLGLAIVRELARANGWTVSLSARPGGGMQAWLRV
jgi:two-component system osmolarity sensor histidine kinase EnvZ